MLVTPFLDITGPVFVEHIRFSPETCIKKCMRHNIASG